MQYSDVNGPLRCPLVRRVSRLWRFSRDAGSRLDLDSGEAARAQKRHDPSEIRPEAVERIRRHLDES